VPKSSTQIETFVSPEDFREVVLAFEKYPEFLSEVKRIEVHERSDSHALVTFHIEIKFAGFEVKTHYKVRYAIDGNTISWKLVESPTLTANEGSWRIEEGKDGGDTVLHYEAEVATNLPIPPDVQNLFAKEELPKLMQKFRDRAEG
jgi:coenzyme Q-binding protein COQ10